MKQRILVILCHKLDISKEMFDDKFLNQNFKKDFSVEVLVINNLGTRLGDIHALVGKDQFSHLVIGVSTDEVNLATVQVQAQQLSIHPFAVEIVLLGSGSPLTRSFALLWAAIARLHAFSGASPNNVRSVTMPRQAITRRDFFSLPKLTQLPAPTIDSSVCRAAYGCEVCAANCHGDALTNDGGVIHVNREKCTSCGVCLSRCPSEAVQFPRWSREEMNAWLASLLQCKDVKQGPVLFLCHQANLPSTANNWLPVRVPCQAYMTVPLILQTLTSGASVVGIQSCGDKCLTGESDLIDQRIDFCQKLLKAFGQESSRVYRVNNSDPSTLLPPKVDQHDYQFSMPFQGFGLSAYWEALTKLTETCLDQDAVQNIEILHTASPVGVIEINEEVCTVCGTCAGVCPTRALTFESEKGTLDLDFDPTRCIGCSECVKYCPEREGGAITIHRSTQITRFQKGKQTVSQDAKIACQKCHEVFATTKMLKKIKSMLGEDFNSIMGDYCTRCRSYG